MSDMSWRIVLLVMALLIAACGIPVEAEPEVVDVELALPAGNETPAPGELGAVSLYLVRDDSLVHVTRDLPSPPSLTSIFQSLLGGVIDEERQANLRTAIPPGSEIISITEDGSILRVDLNSEFAAVGGEEELLAVAQIVMTATGVEGVERVAFQLEGVPTDVPVASGALSEDPVGAADYEALVATDS